MAKCKPKQQLEFEIFSYSARFLKMLELIAFFQAYSSITVNLNLQPNTFYDLNTARPILRYNYTVLFNGYAEQNPLFNVGPNDVISILDLPICNTSCVASFVFDFYLYENVQANQMALLQSKIVSAWTDQNADSISTSSISLKIIGIEDTWTTPDGYSDKISVEISDFPLTIANLKEAKFIPSALQAWFIR
jgi:hypothetical protein